MLSTPVFIGFGSVVAQTDSIGFGFIYLHHSVGLSVARFDNPGNAKALIAWNEWQNGSTLFLCVSTFNINRLIGTQLM